MQRFRGALLAPAISVLSALAACAPAAAPAAAAPPPQAGAAPASGVAGLRYENVEQVRYRLLEEQDTDCDQKITVNDSGSGRFRFRLHGESHELRGTNALSNLLQELSIARQSGEPPRLDRVSEDPIARTSRLIRTRYWDALTRRLDEQGLPRALDDPKIAQGSERVLYVPREDERALEYFTAVAQRHAAAYASLAGATVGLGALELSEGELAALLRTPEGRDSLAKLSIELAAAAERLSHPALAEHLKERLSQLGALLEQAGRSCVHTDPAQLARLGTRARDALSAFGARRLRVERVPERERWAEWVAGLGAAHGILSLALEPAEEGLRGVPFVVPGGRFNEMYGWDSYFILRGLLVDERLDLARGLVENAAYVIERYGGTLNANRTYYLLRSQPPFFAAMARAVWEATPPASRDPRWLARMLRAAIAEYAQVWGEPPRRSRVCRGEGPTRACLDHYAGLGKGQPPEVEPGHFDWLWEQTGRSLERSYASGTLAERDLVAELDDAFEHDRCMRESGHDTTYRWFWAEAGRAPENRCAEMLTVDLNSLLYRYEVDVAFLLAEAGAAAAGAPPPATWCARARHRFELMKEHLWSSRDKLFYDARLTPGGTVQTGYVSATTLYPLWATRDGCTSGGSSGTEVGLGSREKSLLVTNALARLEAPGGLLASAKASRDRFSSSADRQWDYPYGWAPHQMLAWEGLEAHGFRQDAERLISSWLHMMARNVIDHNGTIPEKYDVVARTHAVFAEYGNVGTEFDYIATEGFGWMNASFQVGLRRLSSDERRRLSQSLAAR